VARIKNEKEGRYPVKKCVGGKSGILMREDSKNNVVSRGKEEKKKKKNRLKGFPWWSHPHANRENKRH